MKFHNEPIDLGAIKRCKLLLVEGVRDDVNGQGATFAAAPLV